MVTEKSSKSESLHRSAITLNLFLQVKANNRRVLDWREKFQRNM